MWARLRFQSAPRHSALGLDPLPEAMRFHCWNCLRTEGHLKSLRPSVCLQVHHVIEVERNGSDDPENLQLLCAECHADVHRRREAFARYTADC